MFLDLKLSLAGSWREAQSEAWTHLDNDAGLCGFLAVLEQGVGAATREVVVESVKGLKVVLTPRPARHLPLKARIWNWIKEDWQNLTLQQCSHLTVLKKKKEERSRASPV